MRKFIDKLEKGLKEQIQNIKNENCDHICQIERIIIILSEANSALLKFLNTYEFKDQQEEIHFFKISKPQIVGQLIFFSEVFRIESEKYYGTADIIKNYYASEISKIEEYFNSTINFYRYYTSGSAIQDHVYFIRNIKTFCNGSDYSLHYLDYRTSTKYDFIAAKINAYSQLMVYLKNEIDKLSEPTNKSIEPKQIKQLTWTESNVSLVEICYAFHYSGAINNGQ